MKKIKWAAFLFFILGLIFIYLFRFSLLEGCARFLIVEDELQYASNTFVLSGSPYDRGNLAAAIYHQKITDTLICTGENIPHDFKAMGWQLTEAEITRNHVQLQQVPKHKIILLQKGTSTFEEAAAILEFCEKRGIKKIIVVSSDFHTRRVRQVFKAKFNQSNIEVIIRAAPSSGFSISHWWQSEQGLIALQNEYVKLAYYFFKY